MGVNLDTIILEKVQANTFFETSLLPIVLFASTLKLQDLKVCIFNCTAIDLSATCEVLRSGEPENWRYLVWDFYGETGQHRNKGPGFVLSWMLNTSSNYQTEVKG